MLECAGTLGAFHQNPTIHTRSELFPSVNLLFSGARSHVLQLWYPSPCPSLRAGMVSPVCVYLAELCQVRHPPSLCVLWRFSPRRQSTHHFRHRGHEPIVFCCTRNSGVYLFPWCILQQQSFWLPLPILISPVPDPSKKASSSPTFMPSTTCLRVSAFSRHS